MRDPINPPLDYAIDRDLSLRDDVLDEDIPLASPSFGQWFLASFLVGSILVLGALGIAKCAGAF